MPLQRISVKNNETENWIMTSTEPVYTQESARLGSTSSNISFSNNDICRICHCEADTQNPLLSPCYCSGSLKYVHQACLQQWLTASETRSCELCKFNFIMHTKIKPFNEWRRLEMSGVERRRLGCAVLFHCIAALCVIWSLFVLIDRATEEVQKGLIAWPFWTKLVVVAVGFTGGAVFMYIQCRQYLHLCNRWKAHNRILLIQNAPEKVVAPPSPTFRISIRPSAASTARQTSIRPAQVIANIENNPLSNLHHKADSQSQNSADSALSAGPSELALITNVISKQDSNVNNHNLDESYVFGERNSAQPSTSQTEDSIFENSHDKVYVVQALNNTSKDLAPAKEQDKFFRLESAGFDPLEINIQEMLALDIEHAMQRSKTAKTSVVSLADANDSDNKRNFEKNKSVFKSLPNLSTSNEKLLP